MILKDFCCAIPKTLFVAILATAVVGIAGQAFAQQPTQGDWRQLGLLQAEYAKFQAMGDAERMAVAAERIVAFMARRFPARLQFVGQSLLADARAAQSRIPEAIKLHEQVLEATTNYRPASASEQSEASRFHGAALRGLAACHGRLGNWPESIKRFQETIAWWDQSDSPQAPLLAADARKDLAFVYRNQGQSEDAGRLFRQAIASLEKLAIREDPPSYATLVLGHALGGLASLDIRNGRYDLAEPKLLRAVPLLVSVRGLRHPVTAQLLVDLGNVYESQRRWDEAEPYYKIALEGYEKSYDGNHPELMRAVVSLGRVLHYKDRLPEAEALFRRAVESYSKRLDSDHAAAANAKLNLAGVLVSAKRLDEAERLLAEAAMAFGKNAGPSSDKVAETLMVLAALKAEQTKVQEASQIIDHILKINEVNPLNPRYLVHIYNLRARLLWSAGQRNQALQALDFAIQQAELQRSYSTGAELERAETFARFADELDTMILWQAELNDDNKLFAAIERSKARSFLDELRLADVDLLAGLSSKQQSELAEREAQLRKALTAAEHRLDKLPPPAGDGTLTEERRRAVRAVVAAREDLYRHLVEVRAQSPIYHELIAAEAEFASLADVQKAIGAKNLVLAYTIGGEASFVLAIRRDAVTVSRLTVEKEAAAALDATAGPLTTERLAELLVTKKGSVFEGLSKRGDLARLDKQLHALWNTLVPESERKALQSADVETLVILPDGLLGLLPFEALVVSPADQATQYLLDVGPPIAYAPSASVFLNLARREELANNSVLTVGDPAYPQQPASKKAASPVSQRRQSATVRAQLTRLPFWSTACR